MLLKDKVTLITGAGRGWGQAIAQVYARQGAKVIAVSRTQSELDRTAALIAAEGGHCHIMSVDIADDASVQKMVDDVLETYGRLDVLVNNAGVLYNKSFEDTTIADWDLILNVNLRGTFLTCKAFLNTMKAQGGGSIINVSSRAGIMAFAEETAYCASKWGLEGFSKALADALQPYNIAVNTISPGGAHIKPTSITQAEFDAMSEAERAKWDDPMIITEAFVYLALQDGSGLTRQRVAALPLSDQIREHGWDVTYEHITGL